MAPITRGALGMAVAALLASSAGAAGLSKGMTADEVRAALGTPQAIEAGEHEGVPAEIWHYGSAPHRVVVADGRLVAWEDDAPEGVRKVQRRWQRAGVRY